MFDLLTAPANLSGSLQYDYTEIAPQHRETVKESAIVIKQRIKRVEEDVIAIGQELTSIKRVVEHGQFVDLITTEFAMDPRIAQHLMQVAERFADKNETVTFFKKSVLYMLAAPSTPDEAIDAAIEYAKSNGSPTKAEAQRIIAEHKELRYLNDTEAETAIWRAIQAQRYSRGSDMLRWMATAMPEDYRRPLNPGVVLEDDTLAKALAKVRGDIQRMADKEAPPPPPPPPPPPAKPARAVYVEPVAPPPPQEAVSGEIVEDDEDEIDALPPASNRNVRLRYILAAYKEALRLVPEYGTLTGCHSQGLQIKRALEDAAKNLESNLV